MAQARSGYWDSLSSRFWKRWAAGLLLTLLVAFAVGACRDEPAPLPPTPVPVMCNPIPVDPSPLPDFVESVTFQEPEIHGPIHSLHVAEEMLYLGFGDSFGIMDASNAAEPELVGTFSLYDQPRLQSINYVSIVNKLAYVGWASRNFVVDFSNLENLKEVYCNTGIPSNIPLFAERYSFFRPEMGGIIINERPLDAGSSRQVAHYANYTATEISWNRSPDQLVPRPDITRPRAMIVRSFTFDDRYLYMIDVNPTNSAENLSVIDLKNPSNPRRISMITLGYGPGFPSYLRISEGFLFIVYIDLSDLMISEMKIYDIRNKEELVELTSAFGTSLPLFDKDHAYIPTLAGLDVWKLGSETEPELVNNIEIAGAGNIVRDIDSHQLAKVGDYIYFAAGSSLVILDNQAPGNPVVVYQEAFPLTPHVERIAISEGLIGATVGEAQEQEIQTLEIDDQGNMGEWRLVPGSLSDERFRDIVMDDHIYSIREDNTIGGYGSSLLAFLPNSEFDSSLESNVYFPDYQSWKMAADNQYLYMLIVREDSAITIVDIANSASPVIAGEIDLDLSFGRDLVVWDDDLYVFTSDEDRGLYHVDISDWNAPELIGFYPLDYYEEMTGGDGLLFGMNYQGQIQIIDLRPNSEPKFLGPYTFVRGVATDIAYEDGVLYLAMGNRGLAAVALDLEGIEKAEVGVEE